MMNYSYLTILNAPLVQTRTFVKIETINDFESLKNLTEKDQEDLKRSLNTLELIKSLKTEYNNKYNENFIIEILMKVSNDVDDLKQYLNNPHTNIGKQLWK